MTGALVHAGEPIPRHRSNFQTGYFFIEQVFQPKMA
jgi:hypothetical protein